MRATLTITGLYNYDNAIFDGWEVPEGVSMDELKNLILYECSGLELTIPSPDLFKICTTSWCKRKARSWQRAFDAMKAQYNPIHNYDRSESYTDAESGSSGHSGELSSTTEEKTAAFNSSAYTNKDQVTNGQESESSATYGKSVNHIARVSGNIGVTTSQQMIEAEEKLADGGLDIYHFICRDFKREFTLAIY